MDNDILSMREFLPTGRVIDSEYLLGEVIYEEQEELTEEENYKIDKENISNVVFWLKEKIERMGYDIEFTNYKDEVFYNPTRESFEIFETKNVKIFNKRKDYMGEFIFKNNESLYFSTRISITIEDVLEKNFENAMDFLRKLPSWTSN